MPTKSKKKQQKNGFFYFMKKIQTEAEEAGMVFGDLKEVSEYASPLWDNLTPQEKAVYSQFAVSVKNSAVAASEEDSTKKFTSLGVSFATIDEEKRKLEEYNAIMSQTIRNTVRGLDRDSTFKTQTFFLCHVNVFYIPKVGDPYYPAEIALAEFCLKDGVINTIHFIVDPVKIPLGYTYEANDWISKYHQIPTSDVRNSERNYEKMFFDIANFISKGKGGSLPPVYTMPNSLPSNTSIAVVKETFKILCDAADEAHDVFKVYPLPTLFYELRRKCLEGTQRVFPSEIMLTAEIERDLFGHSRSLACEFHEEMDLSVSCSLAIAVRWAFCIFENVCKHVDIPLVVGKHCPRDTDVHWSTRNKNKPKKPIAQTNQERGCSPPPSMPTIIDYGKLKEKREGEKQKADNLVVEEDLVRYPLNWQGRQPYGGGPSKDELESRESFPEIGTLGRGRHTQSTIPSWPILGRGRQT